MEIAPVEKNNKGLIFEARDSSDIFGHFSCDYDKAANTTRLGRNTNRNL